ncbi:DUF58 domain-containing protein [Pseudoneobacillus sp. C159]
MVWRKDVHGGNALDLVTVIGVVLLLVSFYQETYWLIFLGSLLIVICQLSLYYLKHVADDLELENGRQTIRLSVGEETTLNLQLSQLSILPIYKGMLEVKLESIVEGVGIPSFQSESNVVFTIPFHLRSKESLQIPLHLKALKRGATRIKSVHLTIQNFFGYGFVELTYNPFIHKELIIHPTPIAVPQTEKLFATMAQGDFSAPSSIHEHILAPIGTRDYVYSDSFARIHWKASAKMGTLQTKVFEKTAHYSWTFIVNLREPNTPTYHLGVVENLESIASNIAYLAQFATKKGIEFELFLNLRMASESAVYHLPKGSGTKQLGKVLDLLARITERGNTVPLRRMFQYVDKQQQHSPVVIYSGPYDDEGVSYFSKVQKMGQKVYILQDDNEYPAVVPFGRS